MKVGNTIHGSGFWMKWLYRPVPKHTMKALPSSRPSTTAIRGCRDGLASACRSSYSIRRTGTPLSVQMVRRRHPLGLPLRSIGVNIVRIVGASVAVAAMVAITAVTVTRFGYLETGKRPEFLVALVVIWVLFAVAVVVLRRAPLRA